MSEAYSFCPDIQLYVKGQIPEADASRQQRTAAEILRRLAHQPGVILADEVGMGKTFVALAVAVSVAMQNRGKRPVVVMVPSSLKEKWPADFALLSEKCLSDSLREKVTCATAERAVDFLKLLDDPPERRKAVIFLTHGAMSRGLDDPWVMLALIRQSLHRRRNTEQLRSALHRSLGELLQLKWAEKHDESLWEKLLKTPPAEWQRLLIGIDKNDDDPVPAAICQILSGLNTDAVYEAIWQIPLRNSKHYDKYIVDARHAVKKEVRNLWVECLSRMKLKLPLLILDEAHHLKNAGTHLASLFHSPDAQEDAEEIAKGPLAGVFERMLFLTATPFQLGHGELCSVLDRFDGICWKGASAPESGREKFGDQRKKLRDLLDAAQLAAVNLDHAWGRLTSDDLCVGDKRFENADEWWKAARTGNGLTPTAVDAHLCFQDTLQRMTQTEEQLQLWVIRHLKARHLAGDMAATPRRNRLVGRSICLGETETEQRGIPVSGDALLPFLLAARASSHSPDARPVFAEGLASSYEAFLNTRKANMSGAGSNHSAIDGDDEGSSSTTPDDVTNWYLNRLEVLIPRDSAAAAAHPKVSATIERVVDLWKRGEKSVVFCHYIATGRALRAKISDAIRDEIWAMGAAKTGCTTTEVGEQLDQIGRRFFDEDSPIRKECDAQASRLLEEFPVLANDETTRTSLIEIVRRNVRTPSFLVRFFPLNREPRDAEAMRMAFGTSDSSGQTLRDVLKQFFVLLAERCGEVGRMRYIDAVKRIQTGSHFGVETAVEYDSDELQDAAPDQLMPNVRLVNGTTRSETRQRLMLTFNTPFDPEILVASSVMA